MRGYINFLLSDSIFLDLFSISFGSTHQWNASIQFITYHWIILRNMKSCRKPSRSFWFRRYRRLIYFSIHFAVIFKYLSLNLMNPVEINRDQLLLKWLFYWNHSIGIISNPIPINIYSDVYFCFFSEFGYSLIMKLGNLMMKRDLKLFRLIINCTNISSTEMIKDWIDILLFIE
jgi:hypothetical protein